jgi:hypothetical protein
LPGGQLTARGVDVGATIASDRGVHAELFEQIAERVHTLER